MSVAQLFTPRTWVSSLFKPLLLSVSYNIALLLPFQFFGSFVMSSALSGESTNYFSRSGFTDSHPGQASFPRFCSNSIASSGRSTSSIKGDPFSTASSLTTCTIVWTKFKSIPHWMHALQWRTALSPKMEEAISDFLPLVLVNYYPHSSIRRCWYAHSRLAVVSVGWTEIEPNEDSHISGTYCATIWKILLFPTSW